MYREIRRTYFIVASLLRGAFNNKVEVINLNANDICNSKCRMCNIWKNKKDFEFKPSELRLLLRDPLYKHVRHVGITGGEPTLRSDLESLYESVIDSLPKLSGLSIITNAIKPKIAIEKILKIEKLCSERGKSFSVMVSLDGLGEIHDHIRGREGNFQTAMEVIDYLKSKTNIPVSIGCTITKANVWHLNEFLHFLKKNDIYGRFRIAEFIDRLYNQELTHEIRNFNRDEIYNLQLFFYKLIFDYEKSNGIKRTYYSIINMLDGGKRLIGCPYKRNGIVINSKGELSYCAPKSPIIGSGIKDSSRRLFEQNISIFKNIKKQHCNSCIHDYHFRETFIEYLNLFKKYFWSKLINIYHPNRIKYLSRLIRKRKDLRNNVFIVGWYGTETIGDKAILGGIIDYFKSNYENEFRFSISSLYPIITERTLKELGLKNVEVVPVYSNEFIRHSMSSSMVVMGGGPLMDLEELAIPLISFMLASLYNNHTIVYGCGIGPLTKYRFQKAVKQILNIASEVKLRDNKSKIIATKDLNVFKPILVIDDPAKDYITKAFKLQKATMKKDHISCYLRDWTYEYYNHVNKAEFKMLKRNFEKGLSNLIQKKCVEYGCKKIRFYHMHNFIVGNDDRDFSLRFTNEYFGDEYDIFIDNDLSSVERILQAMSESSLNICMRYHSVLFAHAIRTDFLAIDYTNGGKINSFMRENSTMNNLISIDDLTTMFA